MNVERSGMATVASTTQTYAVAGMHCQDCTRKVAAALEGVSGVESARVTLTPPVAEVDLSRPMPWADLNRAVKAVGPYSLFDADSASLSTALPSPDKAQESFYPLLLILTYLLGATLLFAWLHRDFSVEFLMTRFMGGFFVVFSFFKLLDLKGFAEAYRSYDVVAQALRAWGLVYPFVELALGVAYLGNWRPFLTSAITLGVMAVSSIGVLKALLAKRAIRCACLGTVLNLPMTKVTLIEDLGMAVMAAMMLLRGMI